MAMLELAALLLLCAAVDGDTLACGSERVRVLNIDTPELHGQCAAEIEQAYRAKARTADLIAGGVVLERQGLDKFGRRLARVVLPDGRDLGGVLISEGLAREWDGRREPWRPKQ